MWGIESTAAFRRFFEVCTKIAFLIAVPMQTMLWPTVSSITFLCVYGLVNIVMYFTLERGKVWEAITNPGIYVFRTEKTPANYIFMMIMFCYFAIYFFVFITEESTLLPSNTLWLYPTIAPNFTSQSFADLPVDVTNSISQQMLSNSFEWTQSIQVQAPLVSGVIAGVGQGGAPIICNGQGGFKCYAKAWSVLPPSWLGEQPQPTFLPLASQFYDVDVAIAPGAGKRCADLEVYRLGVDVNLNVIQPLDYPASTIPNSQNRLPVQAPPCKLFSNTSSLCLQVSHTFTPAQYTAQLAAQCQAYNQQLIFRLPPRGADVNPESGIMMLDILLVTDTASSVQLSGTWNAANTYNTWFLFSTFWNQIISTYLVQSWRLATDSTNGFFKFMIASLPAIVTWYYLSSEFLEYIASSGILFLSIFIELPAILLFLSLGAWVPMAGSIVCVMAVNYDVEKKREYWQRMIRPTLLFIKAACNSIQFVWLLVLVGQASWSAFYYQFTLDKLYTMSYQFIITNQSSPTFVSLMLPIILLVNAAFLLGTAFCVVLEGVAGKLA